MAAMKKINASVRVKDKEIKCSCGGKTFPVGMLIAKSVIRVEIRCYICNKVLYTYKRYTYRHREEDLKAA